ncbi:phosphatase PAP2 family protein [Profundibacter sp.]
MRSFFLFASVYLIFAILFAPFFMDGGMTGFLAVTQSAKLLWKTGTFFLIGILIGLIILVMTVGRDVLRARLPLVGLALIATVFLQSGFTILKNVMSFITPYFADPFMANLDSALHFGVDPWVIAHWIGGYLPTDLMIYSYLTIWALPAFALPVIIALTDGDRARMTRTLILYAVAWAFVGNVLAFAGLSVGPVYYDRLLGGERFADLTVALVESGVTASSIGITQQALWEIYAGQSALIGSGISAFPSVHVAVATVAAIYMCERSKWLVPLAATFLFFTFYLSVFTGYHYAVDGYASIIVIFIVWGLLRRRNNAVL